MSELTRAGFVDRRVVRGQSPHAIRTAQSYPLKRSGVSWHGSRNFTWIWVVSSFFRIFLEECLDLALLELGFSETSGRPALQADSKSPPGLAVTDIRDPKAFEQLSIIFERSPQLFEF